MIHFLNFYLLSRSHLPLDMQRNIRTTLLFKMISQLPVKTVFVVLAVLSLATTIHAKLNQEQLDDALKVSCAMISIVDRY